MSDLSAADVVGSYSRTLAGRDCAAARALLAEGLGFDGVIGKFDHRPLRNSLWAYLDARPLPP